MSQLNDIKVRIKLTVNEDDAALNISTATAKSIIIRKPDGTRTVYTATFLTDGSDSIIYYDTVSGDLDQSGVYKVQGLILMASGTYYTTVQTFRVECNI